MRTVHKNAANKSDRKGSINVLAALCLIIGFAFLAFAVDGGCLVVTHSELQNAADAGALSGARALSKGNEAAMNAAELWSSKNLAAGKSITMLAKEDIQIGLWDEESASFEPLPANSSVTPNAIQVTCRKTTERGNPLKLFFASVIGTSSADVSATATARVATSRCGLIIGIERVTMSGSSFTDSYRSSEGPYSKSTAGFQGTVCSNGVISMSGSTMIIGDAHPGPDQIVDTKSSKGVQGNITPLEKLLSHPPVDASDVAVNHNNSQIPKSTKKKQPLNSKNEFSLSGNDTVDLPPGKYYFSKMTLSGGSSIRINGPTEIYVTGDVDMSGGSLANLESLPQNLQLFPMGSKCVISGNAAFHGVVYGPNTKVERSGSSDFFGSIIAGELVLSGSGGIHADESLDSQLLGGGMQRSKLVQ